MDEFLASVSEWYNTQKSPNSYRRYYACPICNATWWGDGGMFGREHHNFDCWIPLIDRAKLESQKRKAENK